MKTQSKSPNLFRAITTIIGWLSMPSLITVSLMSCWIGLKAPHVNAQPPANIPWFTAQSGPVRCSASKIVQVPLRIQYGCTNPYGSNYGAFTADATNGSNGTTYFYISANSQSRFITTPTGPVVTPQVDTNLSCLIQVNSTNFDAIMLNGVTLPAQSASYSCSGFSTNGSGTISWP